MCIFSVGIDSVFFLFFFLFFFFKQKTAYEMCGRDWSSDVCSSDLTDRTTTALAHNIEMQVEMMKNPL